MRRRIIDNEAEPGLNFSDKHQMFSAHKHRSLMRKGMQSDSTHHLKEVEEERELEAQRPAVDAEVRAGVERVPRVQGEQTVRHGFAGKTCDGIFGSIGDVRRRFHCKVSSSSSGLAVLMFC